MVFQNVGPGQEDPSLALHNAIFCTKRNYCATSSTLGVVASDAVVHKGEFISCTIYFFPGSDVYCSTTFFLLSRSTWFFSSCILTCVFLRVWFTLVLLFTMVCLHPKTMFAGKTYTIFEWKACFRNHVASIHSFSPLHSLLLLIVVDDDRCCCCHLLSLSRSSMCFISMCHGFVQEEYGWRHLKNGLFEYLLRLCGEKPFRPNDIVHATRTQHVTTL